MQVSYGDLSADMRTVVGGLESQAAQWRRVVQGQLDDIADHFDDLDDDLLRDTFPHMEASADFATDLAIALRRTKTEPHWHHERPVPILDSRSLFEGREPFAIRTVAEFLQSELAGWTLAEVIAEGLRKEAARAENPRAGPFGSGSIAWSTVGWTLALVAVVAWIAFSRGWV